ncbi:hypothetical protein [Ruegeria hyattellae]|uniref:hypothetical protein n=1 Tax=Ruegeria hyattellae TaxID=3233337 RepID=UPI00355BD54C
MLHSVVSLLHGWDEPLANAIAEKADLVRGMHEDIKLFLAQLNHSRLEDGKKERSSELANIAYNLETAADAISTGLIDQVRHLYSGQLKISANGLSDFEDFHDRVLSNAQLALDVLMNGAPDAAGQLLRAKEKARAAERKLQERHLERLCAGISESFETSRMHQESLRILKNVNTAFATVGYPIAARLGDLLSTRLSEKAKSELKKGT